MAVYKPTNCLPYLTTFDLEQSRIPPYNPEIFECKVDTSNKNVTAYAITVYNNNNEQIFPLDKNKNPMAPQDNMTLVEDLGTITGIGDGFVIDSTGYKYLNTGINGSYLRIPFIVAETTEESSIGQKIKGANTLKYNCLFISPDATSPTTQLNSYTRAVGENEPAIPVPMENGQTYKWVITLFQGVKRASGEGNETEVVLPVSIYEYDMVLTTGTVMGSTIERVQSYLSEEIYIDYYIQPVRPVDDNKNQYNVVVTDESRGIWHVENSSGTIVEDYTLENIGSRVRIKNYDSSYGYIYPQTGDEGFGEAAIKPGSGAPLYQIYSMSNDPQNLTQTRMVTMVPHVTVPWVWEDMASDAGRSYGTQVFYVEVAANSSLSEAQEKIAPFECTYEPNLVNVVEEGETATEIPAIEKFIIPSSRRTKLNVEEEQRIILNNQADDNTWYEDQFEGSSALETGKRFPLFEKGDSPSPYNGIYTPDIEIGDIIQLKIGSAAKNYRRVSISWRRTSDADTWGEVMSKIVYVTSDLTSVTMSDNADDTINLDYSGSNVQTQYYVDDGDGGLVASDDTTTAGTLNQTPFKFNPERPLNIYSFTDTEKTGAQNSELNKAGLILYNTAVGNDWDTSEDGLATLYVRPFIGLEPQMWFRELTTSEATARFFIIKEVNTVTWAIKYDPEQVWTGKTAGSGSTVAADKEFKTDQRYQIRSFFKSSDENPFDLYSNPELAFTFTSIDGKQVYGLDDDHSRYKISARNFHVKAEYTQSQEISWKSYNWSLYDINGVLVGASGDLYDGLIEHEFFGLRNGEQYTLVLTIETYTGNVFSKENILYINFEPISSSEFPFTLSMNCDTNAVELEFLLTGYVIPNVVLESTEGGSGLYRVQSETENNTSPEITGVSYFYDNSLEGSKMRVDNALGTFGEKGVVYDKIANGITEVTSVTDIETQDKEVLIQSRHAPTDSDFTGNFYTSTFSQMATESQSAFNYKFKVYIPEEYEDDVTEGQVVGEKALNPRRNQILYDLINTENGLSILPDGPRVAYVHGYSNASGQNKWQFDRIILNVYQPRIFRNLNNGSGSYGSPNLVMYKDIVNPFAKDYTQTQNEQYHIIRGAFNTTFERVSYSGTGDSAVFVPEWIENYNDPNSGLDASLLELMKPLVNTGDEVIGACMTGFSVKVSDDSDQREDFQVSSQTVEEGEAAVNPTAFQIFNKGPMLWGDTGFFVPPESEDGQYTGYNWASVVNVDNNNNPTSGYLLRSYYEDTQAITRWEDTDNCSVRWFDGWGYDDGRAGVNEGNSKNYDSPNFKNVATQPRINVGGMVSNIPESSQGSLTDNERASIVDKTFTIEAYIGEIDPNNLQSLIENIRVDVYV